MNLTNTKIVLKRRPNPEVSEDLFDIITDTVRELNKEEFLVEVSYVSIDPAMRGWISAVGNYSEPVAFGTSLPPSWGGIYRTRQNTIKGYPELMLKQVISDIKRTFGR